MGAEGECRRFHRSVKLAITCPPPWSSIRGFVCVSLNISVMYALIFSHSYTPTEQRGINLAVNYARKYIQYLNNIIVKGLYKDKSSDCCGIKHNECVMGKLM